MNLLLCIYKPIYILSQASYRNLSIRLYKIIFHLYVFVLCFSICIYSYISVLICNIYTLNINKQNTYGVDILMFMLLVTVVKIRIQVKSQNFNAIFYCSLKHILNIFFTIQYDFPITTYLFIRLPIGLVVEGSPMARETRVQSLVESYQRLKNWYLIPPCLTLSIIKHISRVKWSNPRKGVAPSPTHRCSSSWKGSFRVALDHGRQLHICLLNICSIFI